MVTKNAQSSNSPSKKVNIHKSYKKIDSLVKNTILGVGITNDKKDNILEFILNFIEKTPYNCYIVTPNPEIIVLAAKNPSFKDILNKAEIAICDGIGVLIAGNVLNKPLKERFTGVELIEKLCKRINNKTVSVGFLGGRGSVAEKTVECLQKKYPGLRVSFISSEWDEGGFVANPESGEMNPFSKGQVRQELRKTRKHDSSFTLNSIDILFVAYGAPKQEVWMAEHLNKIPVRVMIGVGGSFDYISGKIPRAPKIVQNIGFEWLYRLIKQPWRIKRQLALVEFVWLVIKERFSVVKN